MVNFFFRQNASSFLLKNIKHFNIDVKNKLTIICIMENTDSYESKKKKWWYAKKEYRVDKDDAFAIQLSWGTCEKVTGTGDTEGKRRWEVKTDIWLYYLLSEESSQLAKEYVE